MKPYEKFFKDKRVTVMGLGLLGRGVGDAACIAQCGAHVVVTDLKTKAELTSSIEQLKKYSNVSFKLGGHDEKDFIECDMVIKAAGVPFDSPYIAAAKKANVPVYMSTALFAKFAMEMDATVLGVTGTRGKSTVTHMIFQVLQKNRKRAHLAGNIRGKSTLALLPEIQKDDMCILELDSWQLQGFGDLQISPHIAVFTNFMPDHLNYYKGDMERYFADKANIFKHQKKGDVIFAGASVSERIKTIHSQLKVPPTVPLEWVLMVPGEHNKENAALAVAALEALGLKKEEIKPHIETFQGVEGRLQFVREINDVKIYNDNNATTPEATIAALKALQESGTKNHESGIILIIGGADKGLEMLELAKEINSSCKAVILLEGAGTNRLLSLLDSRFFIRDSTSCNSLQSALARALEIAQSGDIVLFSPAFASFGMFKNEYDRNDQFLTVVRSL